MNVQPTEFRTSRDVGRSAGSPNVLTERRQADRETMAAQMAALAESLGATVHRSEGGDYPGPRCVRLEIKATGGACLGIDFDGDSCQPDVHVCCWNVDLNSDSCFADRFAQFPDSVNPSHFQKSQFVAYGFDKLMQRVRRDLQLINSGSAYCPERTRRATVRSIERLERELAYYRPLAEAGLGTTFVDGTQHESAEKVAAKVDALPGKIQALRASLAGSVEIAA